MTDQPNTNLYQPQNHQLMIALLPNVTFNLTKVGFPGMSGGTATTPTPFQQLKWSGTSYETDPLQVEVLLNEDFSSHYELTRWIQNRTISRSFEGYKQQAESDLGIMSQATLQLYTSANNKAGIFIFEDLFPISVSGFSLDTQVDSPQPITFQATFQYQDYTLKQPA